MISAIASATLGFLIGIFVPSKVFVGSASEIIAFISLLMAGLLPAMILTATAIKGDSFSATRVKEYGDALRKQLMFWASLFLFALLTVMLFCAAKMLDQSGIDANTKIVEWPSEIDFIRVTQAVLVLSFSLMFVVLSRLYAAYKGLRSLLDLTVKMAEAQALTRDRSYADALDRKVISAAGASWAPQKTDWPQTDD